MIFDNGVVGYVRVCHKQIVRAYPGYPVVFQCPDMRCAALSECVPVTNNKGSVVTAFFFLLCRPANNGLRMECVSVSASCSPCYCDMRVKNTVVSQGYIFSNNTKRSDRYVFPQRCVGVNDGARVNHCSSLIVGVDKKAIASFRPLQPFVFL